MNELDIQYFKNKLSFINFKIKKIEDRDLLFITVGAHSKHREVIQEYFRLLSRLFPLPKAPPVYNCSKTVKRKTA